LGSPLSSSLGSAAEPTAARLVVRNDTGQRYVGWLQGGFFLPSGKRLAGVVDLKIHLKHGRKWRAGVDLPRQAGGYTLRLSGTNPSGGWSPLRRVAVHVVEPEDYHHAVGVGAAYTQHPPSPELLRRMAEDGVKVVRRSRGRWHTERHTVHPYGLKMWYTAAYSSRRICVARERLAEAEQLARRLGECHKDKPTVLNQVMLGEGLSRSPCYCPQCTDAFRRYLRRTHGRLSRLNARWATRYPSFDAIQQLGSPADVDHAAERMALMQRKMPTEVSRRWSELFRLEPGRAIDWKRWHDGVLIDWYRRFARAYHKANRHTTALSEQPCWPNFKHHVLFALGETADLGGMDLYLPGELPATLGYASELMCNFDLNASVFHGKPLWLHELYVQHNSPPGLAEAQGWWLVGRGYRMLSYFTYDHYREGVRAKLPLIFGLFDPQWKPYPCYESFARFSAQVAKFHSEYDLLSLRREEPRVALFLGDDQSLANWLETGGETWGASGVHGHVGAWWLTQRCGFPVEFINEQRFDRLRGKSVLIVPWTHVVGQRALERILRFARRGGTLILDGPVGLYDEHYRAYASLPGGRAFDRLGIRFAGYQEKPNELLFMRRRSLIDVAPETRLPTRGVPFRVKVAAEGKVLAWDGQGSAGLVQRRVGRGQVFALLTSLGRTQRSRRPAPEAVALWGAMLRSAGLRAHHAVTVAGGAEDTPAVDLDHGGAGLKLGGPLCDVALRRRGKDELFVFVVSFFAPTRATVTLRLAEAAYKADDALSHDPVLLRGGGGGGYSFPIDLPAFGAKVIRVRCTSGALELEGRVRLSR